MARRMHGFGRFALALSLCLLAPLSAHALGTPAGTVISNTATLTYVSAGSTLSLTSAPAQTTVLEVLDHTVVWQDAANVTVVPGTNARVLTFVIANTGNGVDRYTLAVDNSSSADRFDPQFSAVHLDHPSSGTQGLYDPGIDPLYTAGSNDPQLDGNDAAADRITVFVLNDIPPGVSAGNLGESRLRVSSNTGTGIPGAVIAGAGEGGVDAIVGAAAGSAAADGVYEVTALGVQLLKTAQIDDGAGGAEPVPGAVITYRIEAVVSGSGTVNALRITDAVPGNTAYVPGSIRVDGAPRSDAADADDADFDVSFSGGVFVDLGDVPGGSSRAITFQVTIE